MGYLYQDGASSQFSHTASYSYDNVNRLTQAIATGNSTYNQIYTYTLSDGSNGQYGNMTCTTGCTPGNWTLDAGTNHLTPSSSYPYDLAGNLTKDSSPSPVHTYQWDAEGRVASVDNGSTWTFTYDAVGDRVQWAYPGGANEHMFDPSGGWLGIYGALDVFSLGAKTYAWYTGTETYFNHINSISSTTVLTKHDGTPAEDILYYPWGQTWQLWGGGGANFAELPYQDGNTNTNITLYRFQSPGLGRWLSPDPVAGDITNPQSLNRYAYVMNNPMRYVDPRGLFRSKYDCWWSGSCSGAGGGGGGSWGDYGGAATGCFMCGSNNFASYAAQEGLSLFGSQWYDIPGNNGLGFNDAREESRYVSIMNTGWDPELGINWNDVDYHAQANGQYKRLSANLSSLFGDRASADPSNCDLIPKNRD